MTGKMALITVHKVAVIISDYALIPTFALWRRVGPSAHECFPCDDYVKNVNE